MSDSQDTFTGTVAAGSTGVVLFNQPHADEDESQPPMAAAKVDGTPMWVEVNGKMIQMQQQLAGLGAAQGEAALGAVAGVLAACAVHRRDDVLRQLAAGALRAALPNTAQR